MPNIGTIVRLADGRIAVVSGITPDGSGDKVLFEDGHEEHVEIYDIAELLTEEPPTVLAVGGPRVGIRCCTGAATRMLTENGQEVARAVRNRQGGRASNAIRQGPAPTTQA